MRYLCTDNVCDTFDIFRLRHFGKEGSEGAGI